MMEHGISRLVTATTVRKCSGTSTMLWCKSKVSSIFKTCVNTSHAGLRCFITFQMKQFKRYIRDLRPSCVDAQLDAISLHAQDCCTYHFEGYKNHFSRLWVESVFSCFVWSLEDNKVSKFLTHLLNKADCEWGPWIPGRKCFKRKTKRRDTRDMIQGAMYGGKPCEGKHYRIVPCKGK